MKCIAVAEADVDGTRICVRHHAAAADVHQVLATTVVGCGVERTRGTRGRVDDVWLLVLEKKMHAGRRDTEDDSDDELREAPEAAATTSPARDELHGDELYGGELHGDELHGDELHSGTSYTGMRHTRG